VYSSHAEVAGDMAIGGYVLDVWLLIHATLYRHERTRNCSRKAVHMSKYLMPYFIMSKVNTLHLIVVKYSLHQSSTPYMIQL